MQPTYIRNELAACPSPTHYGARGICGSPNQAAERSMPDRVIPDELTPAHYLTHHSCSLSSLGRWSRPITINPIRPNGLR